MEPKMPEMYFHTNLHEMEPLSKYSIYFLHHELGCRSFESKRSATPTQSRLQNLNTCSRNWLKTYVKINITLTLFTRKTNK